MIRVNGSSRQLLDVDAEVGEDLVELIPCGVRRPAFGYGGLEASEEQLLLKMRALLVEVPSDEELAAGELGEDVVYGNEQPLDCLVGALWVLWS